MNGLIMMKEISAAIEKSKPEKVSRPDELVYIIYVLRMSFYSLYKT